MSFDRVVELEQQLAEKEKEARYYRNLAKKVSDDRLREAEELSKLTAYLKEKIKIIDEQRQELEELNQQMEKSSITDELTGLLNRRGIMSQAKQIFQSVKRRNYENRAKNGNSETFVCALLDIDFLKKINDTYGHLAGDKFMAGLSEIFSEPGRFRGIDIVGRFGGDEFMFILPKCTEKDALIPLGRLIQSIKDREIVIALNQAVNITVSIGVSEYRWEDNDINNVIARADEALYYAKEQGRDRIVLSSDINRLDNMANR
jgi:diguanylate cyclase (GGDEF)-like protein